jgi:hypothetical protein
MDELGPYCERKYEVVFILKENAVHKHRFDNYVPWLSGVDWVRLAGSIGSGS